MVGAVLHPNQGISHQLFAGAGEDEEAPADDDEEEGATKVKNTDIL